MKIREWFVSRKGEQVSTRKAVFGMLLACMAVMGFFWISLIQIEYAPDFSFLPEFRTRILEGFLMTVLLSAASMLLSMLLGLLSAAGCGSQILVLRYLCRIYVTFIRGTPLIMQIYLFYYIVGTAWGMENRFAAGVVILSVFEGAFISEIIRGSLLSIEASQLEAARAVGFTRKQTMRYVVLPQMVARTLPALTGQFASVIKDSSLLSMISVIELTQTMREISAGNLKLVECYLFLGVLYLVLTLPVAWISRRMERRFRYEA